MLRCQFLCHVLKAPFFIKIALKLSYFCTKMQHFRALGAPPPDPQNSPPLRISGYAPMCEALQCPILLFGISQTNLNVPVHQKLSGNSFWTNQYTLVPSYQSVILISQGVNRIRVEPGPVIRIAVENETHKRPSV